MKRIVYTKETILQAIRYAAKKLGHLPTIRELTSLTGIASLTIHRRFDSYSGALRAAGFTPPRGTSHLPDEALLEDWGAIVREVKRIPTTTVFGRLGKFSAEVLMRRFGRWTTIPAAFLERFEARTEWADVHEIIKNSPRFDRSGCRPSISRPACLTLPGSARFAPQVSARIGEGIHPHQVGTPPPSGPHLPHLPRPPARQRLFAFRGLLHEPANEQTLVFLFGVVALDLGFLVQSLQQGFPDCLALWQMPTGKWRCVRIEFEFQSRNFFSAGHPLDGCDLIVCWRHNWPECPLEVIELATAIRTLPIS